MAIPEFFQEILRFVIQKNSKIPNFEYEVIWRTSIHSKLFQMQLSGLRLAKVMDIPDSFQEHLRIFKLKTLIRTNLHFLELPSLQLAKVIDS
jgi:hypothetical protein